MPRRHSGWYSFTLLLAMLVLPGCDSDKTESVTASGTAASGSSAVKEAKSDVSVSAQSSDLQKSQDQKQEIVDWSVPDAAILVSGEQNGYLEPCGCTSGQLGGLKRRYDLCEQLKAKGWHLVPIDLGSLIKDPGASLGGLEQTKIKFTVALRALKMMNYQAISLAANDLKLGVLETLGQYLNLGDTPKILAANIKPAAGFEQTIVQSHIANSGTKKVGLTSVIDPKSLDVINDPTLKELLAVSDPKASLANVAPALESGSDYQVLMVQGSVELAKTLAEAYPFFDLVVSASVYEDPTAEAEKVNDGKTLIINVGKKGKYNGLVGFFPGTEEPVRFKRVTLDSKFDGPQAGEPIRKLIDEDFQSELKAANVVANFPRRSPVNATPGATYVGAGSCKSCHPNTYTKWLTSKHALAYEPLTNPKRNREFDAECITCHTTGFEYESGWVSTEKTAYLQGNQCENCHGPASFHVADPDNSKFRQSLALTSELADRNMLCIRCHDSDNSPKFKFETYWPQVMHKGLDKYDNPRAHKGLNSEEIARLQKALLADQSARDKDVQKAKY